MNVVECRNLTKKYGSLKAVDGLSFSIEENRITGLIGRNGAGKTTLLKMAAGFLKPDGGHIEVFSINPFNSLRVSSNMVFVDDSMHFPASMSLREILREAKGFYSNWNMKLADRLTEYFSLDLKKNHKSLSKGMKSTFNVIVGMAARCMLTIYDEPTSGMDSPARKDFYRALLKDYMAYPRTVIISSHLLGEIEEILEDILLIDQGSLFLHKPIDELKGYATGLRGLSTVIREQIPEDELLFCRKLGRNSIFVVAVKDGERIKRLKTAGVEMVPVSTDDLCVYLTASSRGGIDNVFDAD